MKVSDSTDGSFGWTRHLIALNAPMVASKVEADTIPNLQPDTREVAMLQVAIPTTIMAAVTAMGVDTAVDTTAAATITLRVAPPVTVQVVMAVVAMVCFLFFFLCHLDYTHVDLGGGPNTGYGGGGGEP
jgi:hypothetical protein